MSAVFAQARAAVARRRLQTLIIGLVVLLSAATGVLALGLLAVSHGPFDAAFAKARGAHMAATFAAGTPTDQLAATAHGTGVTAAAGPFASVSVSIMGDQWGQQDTTVVGRADQNGPVDRLSLDLGTWLTGPGQIVLSRDVAGGIDNLLGSTVTLDLPGQPKLKVVGVAASATRTADAWVSPDETSVLHAGDTQPQEQMLYRFSAAGTDGQVRSSLASVTASLPADSLAGSTSWLAVRQHVNRSISAYVPFVIAFAVLGLVLAVLITTNVVGGAVVSGFRTIGVLKTLGFTPTQVVGVYVTQAVVPAVVGSVLGSGLGILLAVPLLADTRRAYNLPVSVGGVPLWAVLTVLVGAPLLVAVAATGPALRAGRLAANEAISVGRAPRAGHGFRLRRALTASPLPRPVALGAAMPVARPLRAVGTVVALMLGVVTLVFAIGLSASLGRVHTAFTRVDAVPVIVELPPKDGGGGIGLKPGPTNGPDPAVVMQSVTAQSGTARAVQMGLVELQAAGMGKEVRVHGYSGEASWVGYRMVSGRWYSGGDEVVASSYTLRQTGRKVGDTVVLSGKNGQHTVKIVGELLDGQSDLTLVGDASLLALGDQDGPLTIEVGLTPGTSVSGYVSALQSHYSLDTGVYVDNRTQNNDEATFAVLYALIGTLTLLLCGVAALGVLNTVVLTTRERSHEIGVLKSLGMTPGQTRGMVVTSMVGLGLVAGVLAVPVGVAVHNWILPVMGDAAGIGLPHWIVDVYSAAELVPLGLAGVVIAVLGALLPATWAARSRVATALRAE
jgi:putative ABC transport system permease protein